MKLWLCGPASAGRDTYAAAEASLRQIGITPTYGPHDLTPPATATPFDVAKMRLRMLAECDAVCLLDGWSSCDIAEFEHRTAKHLGMRCTALVILLSGG